MLTNKNISWPWKSASENKVRHVLKMLQWSCLKVVLEQYFKRKTWFPFRFSGWFKTSLLGFKSIDFFRKNKKFDSHSLQMPWGFAQKLMSWTDSVERSWWKTAVKSLHYHEPKVHSDDTVMFSCASHLCDFVIKNHSLSQLFCCHSRIFEARDVHLQLHIFIFQRSKLSSSKPVWLIQFSCDAQLCSLFNFPLNNLQWQNRLYWSFCVLKHLSLCCHRKLLNETNLD